MNNIFSYFQKYHFTVALLSLSLLLTFSLNDEKTYSSVSDNSLFDIELLDSEKRIVSPSISLQKIFYIVAKNPALVFLYQPQILQILIQQKRWIGYFHTLNQTISRCSFVHFQRVFQPSFTSDNDDAFQLVG